MISRLRLTIWFLRHPEFYPEFGRRVLGRIKVAGKDRRAEKAEAVGWCEQNATDTNSAIRQITGLKGFQPFQQKFMEQIKIGQEILQQFPPMGEGCAGNIALIYQLAEHYQVMRVIETGVAAGWSSFAFLQSLRNRPGSTLVSTDMPYSFEEADQYVGCVVPAELKPMWHLLRFPDRQSLPKALQILPTIDMCHYDSDKSYDGRLWAYSALWQALRPGGIFISDDIDDNWGFHDFCQKIGQKPWIIVVPATTGVKYVGVFIKEPGSSNGKVENPAEPF
jgi:hypothetical protein